MRNRDWYNRHRWRLKNGIPETMIKECLIPELRETEWSNRFEGLMRNRLVLGAMRYGKIHEPGKPIYDRCSSIIKRLTLYQDTGNKEYLVDIANLCLLEFEESIHTDAHFNSVDDGEHVLTFGCGCSKPSQCDCNLRKISNKEDYLKLMDRNTIWPEIKKD